MKNKGFKIESKEVEDKIIKEIDLFGYWNTLGIYKNIFAELKWKKLEIEIFLSKKCGLLQMVQNGKNFILSQDFFNIFKKYKKDKIIYKQNTSLDTLFLFYKQEEYTKNKILPLINNIENILRYKIACFLENLREYHNNIKNTKFLKKEWFTILSEYFFKKIVKKTPEEDDVIKFLNEILLKNNPEYKNKDIWFASRFFSIGDISKIMYKFWNLYLNTKKRIWKSKRDLNRKRNTYYSLSWIWMKNHWNKI